jgi:hypothetical protein
MRTWMRRVLPHVQRHSVAAISAVVAVISVAAALAVNKETDLATFVATLAVLLVGLVTFAVVSPQPSHLMYDREYTDIDDLVFFLDSDPDRPGSTYAGTIRVQHHVAVWNEGRRKGVLLRLELLAFEDEHGREVMLPGVRLPIAARRFVWRTEVTGDRRDSGMIPVRPPFTLEPDDVVTLRLDTTGGFVEPADLRTARLDEIAAQLKRPIVRASTRIIYRQGGRVVEDAPKAVEVRCVQQAEYVQALEQAQGERRGQWRRQ